MEDLLKISDVPKEYPFSRRTLDRWREKGLISTFRQGEKRVLVSRAELDALMAKKEKVGVGSTDKEARNVGKIVSRCKDTKSSSMKQIINAKKDEDNEDTVSTRENS